MPILKTRDPCPNSDVTLIEPAPLGSFEHWVTMAKPPINPASMPRKVSQLTTND